MSLALPTENVTLLNMNIALQREITPFLRNVGRMRSLFLKNKMVLSYMWASAGTRAEFSDGLIVVGKILDYFLSFINLEIKKMLIISNIHSY